MSASPEELGELLRDGARFGDLDDVREALAQGADVDSADEGGKTGEFESQRERGESRRRRRPPSAFLHPSFFLTPASKKKKKKKTLSPRPPLPALHMAAANGHADAIRLLLSKAADPSPKTKDGGNTPLHWACLNGHAAATAALLEGGASPAALNSAERTPVDEALGGAHQETILGVMREFAARGAGGGGAGRAGDAGAEAEAEALAAAEAEAAVEAEEGGDDDGDGEGMEGEEKA